MENNRAEDRSPILVAVGIAAIIIVTLVVLGLFARQNIPSEGGAVVNAAPEAAPAAEAANNAAAAPEDAAADGDAAATPSDAADAGADADANAAGEPAADASTEEAVPATEAAAATDNSDAAEALAVAFATGGCSGCHTIPNIRAAVGQLGPNLTGIGAAAATRVEGLSAEEYIRQSMLDPEAFIAPTCPSGPCPTGIMLPHYASALSESQFNGVVDYLLSLTAEDVVAAAPEEQAAAPVEEAAPAEEAALAEEAASTEAAAPAEAAPIDMAAVTTAVTKGTCGACHVIPGIDIAVGVIGPDLSTIGAEAATRVAGVSAQEYLHQSIVEPNAVIAPKCPTGDCLPGIMLANLADLLTEEEISTIVGYLLTLNGEAQ